MGGRFTEIPPETFEQIVVDAGVLLRRFDLFDPDYDITPDIITATTGGVELSAEMEITDLGEDVDNCANDTMELARLTSWNCRIASTAVGSSPEIMQMILGAADLSGDIDVIPRAVLNLSDFKDLWWVGDRVDGGLLAVHIANALSISGLSLQTSKAQKGQFDFEIQAHMSIYDLDRIPMTFYVMAPGALEITGITVGDVFVEKGVPTQVPVKFVMGDGSIMDPSDYGHNFTYSATLPTGGTMTADGIITLTGKNDTVDVTVTYTKGDTVLTDEATVKVMDAHVVQVLITEKPIHMEGNSSKSIPLLIRMSDGEEIVPSDRRTGFTYRIEGFPEDVTINENGVLQTGETSGAGAVHVTYTMGGRTVTDSVAVAVEYKPPIVRRNSTILKFKEDGSIYGGTATIKLSVRVPPITIDWGFPDGKHQGKVVITTTTSQTSYTSPYMSTTAANGWKKTISILGDAREGTVSYVYFSGTGTDREFLYNYLEEADIDTTDTLEDGLFAQNYWKSLKIVRIGESVVRIPEKILLNNISVREFYSYQTDTMTLVIPFYRAKKLEKIELHAQTIIFQNPSVKPTGGWWYECNSLRTIDMSHVTSVPTISDPYMLWRTSGGAALAAQVLVPAALLDDFKTATNWSVIADQFVGV